MQLQSFGENAFSGWGVRRRVGVAIIMGNHTRLGWAHGIFLVSGACGLGYQLVWTRWFGLGLGQEWPALLAVVAAFFGGCALGAGGLDDRIRRSRRPAVWYAGLEGAIGCWGLVSVWLIPVAQEWALRLTGLEPSAFRQAAVAFGVPGLVLLPATVAMGAAFPAMEVYARTLTPEGRVVGSLYAVNTLGAMAGTLGSVFLLLPRWGFTATLLGFAVLNLGCAAALLGVAGWNNRRTAATDGNACGAPNRPAAALPAVAGRSAGDLRRLLLLTGLLGIGLEVLGVRLLKGVLENTVFTFASVLAVYLGGTAVGAAGARRVLGARPQEVRLTWLLGGLGVAVGLSGWALALAPATYRILRGAFGDSLGGVALAESGVAASVFGVPTLLMGATFATLAQAAREVRGSVGRALAWNTLGGMLAPGVVGALAFPWLGGKWTLAGLAAGYLCLMPGWRHGRGAALAAAAVLLSLSLPALHRPPLLAGERFHSYRAGIADTVSVVETGAGHRALRVNHRFTMGGTASVNAERRQAHLPLLLHPGPRRVLFLGSGTGITAAAATLHPGVQVDSVELVPEVVALMPAFAPENEAVPGRLRQYVADARRFVRVASARYDVIVADLFHPARDGAGALYTREHFAAVARRLAPGGLFCQWIPLYQVDSDTLGLMVASVEAAFPEVQAFLLRPTVDTPVLGLIGAQPPRAYPEDWMARRVTAPALSAQLQVLGWTDTFQLLSGYLGRAEDLRTGVSPDVDDRQQINWRSARWSGRREHRPFTTLFALLRDLPVTSAGLLETGGDPGLERRWTALVEGRNRYLQGLLLETGGSRPEALEAFLASAEASDDFTLGYAQVLMLAVQISREQPAEAQRLLTRLIAARPERPVAREIRDRLFPPPEE